MTIDAIGKSSGNRDRDADGSLADQLASVARAGTDALGRSSRSGLI
jgi:hypothetical protein